MFHYVYSFLQGEGPADHSGEGARGGEGETSGERGGQSGGGTTAANLAVTSLLLSLTSVADPDTGSGIRCLFDPWIRDPEWVKKSGSGSEMGRKSGSGFGMNNPDHISESLETIFLG